VRSAEEQRASLETMVRTRNLPGSRPVAAQTAFVAGTDLVDRLWQIPNLGDVALNGSTLTIAITAGDPATVCRNVAALAANANAGIGVIRVARGNAAAQCAVPAFLPPAAVLSAVAAAPLVLASREPMVINAAGRSASGDGAAIARIKADAVAQQLRVSAVGLNRNIATVYYENTHYGSDISAATRMSRILLQDTPTEVEAFRMVATVGGQPVRQFEVMRGTAERTFEQTGDLEYPDYVTSGPAPLSSPELSAASRTLYPRFSYNIFPQFRQQLFDPQNPFAVQVLAAAQGSAELFRGFSLNTQLEANIYDNFNVARQSDSVLPHVRTDFVHYFTDGKNGIANLEASYRFRLSPTLFGLVRAGYLESMFAGVGGEILYRPEGARWALGWDLYGVQQRDYDRLFGLQPYHVVTGHMTLYYQSPWYDLNFNFRIGRYLAGDYGVTFELTRRFSTGVEIGAFVTKTNVTPEQFGEGSFDKGIMIRIPLSWLAPLETQAQFGMDLRPVQRDGGQRLLGDTVLFDETRRTSQAELLLQSGP
jgi:hypothetical protein